MKQLTCCVLLLIGLFANAQNGSRTGQIANLFPFYHGVASGDPKADGATIWTRVTPDSMQINDQIDVYWQVATDLDFTNVMQFGRLKTNHYRDFTAKVNVCGLDADTWYYYIFEALGQNSLIGRFKTTAIDTNSAERLAIVSCSNYEHGFFNAYNSIASKNDVDAILHLGDYYYEYEAGGYSANIAGRDQEPSNEIISLSDYRIRNGHYKLDKDLRRLHQLFPFITTWDDHETANDSWFGGAQNHNAGEGDWFTRKSNARNAYDEWMPINWNLADSGKIYRSFCFGDLLDVIVLDTRLWGRDEQDILSASDPTRTLLGNDQMDWLKTQLLDTSTQWKLIAQQVMFAPLEVAGQIVNADQWDGYSASRDEILQFVEQNQIENVIVLTGDIHTSWCNDIPGPNYDALTGQGSQMVEFVTPSVTSPGLPIAIPPSFIQIFNPHMRFVDLTNHGYFVLDVNEQRAQADYTYVDVNSLQYNETAGPSYYVNESQKNLIEAFNPVAAAQVADVPDTIPNQTIELLKLPQRSSHHITNDSILNSCLIDFEFDCPNIAIALVEQANQGLVSFSTGYCFEYEPFENICGADSFLVAFCNFQTFICDTVMVHIQVDATINSVFIDTMVYVDSTTAFCPASLFDDLVNGIDTLYLANQNGSGLVSLQYDSCFSYLSSQIGIEQLQFIACDDFAPVKCDTVYYLIETVKPNYIPSSVNAAILGVYPNPFTTQIQVQFYTTTNEIVKLSLHDAKGAVIFEDDLRAKSGVNYASLNMENLAHGKYTLKLVGTQSTSYWQLVGGSK